MVLACCSSVEKVPQIARMSVWDFSGFGRFQSLLAPMWWLRPRLDFQFLEYRTKGTENLQTI